MLHGIIWSKYTDIKIGLSENSRFLGFCHCEKAIKRRNYIVGLIMPSILGLITLLIGTCIGNIEVLTFGMMIVLGGDEFYVLFLLRKTKQTDLIKDLTIEDSEMVSGLFVFSPNCNASGDSHEF